jgi:hypothetical protein
VGEVVRLAAARFGILGRNDYQRSEPVKIRASGQLSLL